jgi:hypothetical protein
MTFAKRQLKRILDPEADPAPGAPDAIILLFFAALTLFVFWYVWRGAAPELTITGDAAAIAAFTAAQDHPDAFTGDALLHDPDNFSFYRTLDFVLVQWLAKFSGDYGRPFLWLSWPCMLLHAAGFYLLGLAVFRIRIWAAIFSFVTLWFGLIPSLGELWGIYKDPLPRVIFQSLVPFVLAAGYVWRDAPGRWPWVLAAAGLLTYVHPVSAPAWALALWCGFLCCLPSAWSFPRKLGWMTFTGGAFLAVSAPFIITYFTSHSHGATLDYDRIFPILRTVYSRGMIDVRHAILDFLYTASFKFGPGTRMAAPSLLVPGAICAFVFLRKLDRERAISYRIALGWIAGLLIVSAALPFAEHEICRRLRMIPFEINLTRGLRYLVPMCMLLIVWPAAELYKRSESAAKRVKLLRIGLIVSVLWAATHLPPGMARNAFHAMTTGQFKPIIENQADLKQAMDFLRHELPPGTRVFAAPAGRYALAARYYALKPVVFCIKDRNAYAFANHEKLLEWRRTLLRYEKVMARTGERERLTGLMALSRNLGAQVMFLDREAARIPVPDTTAKILFANDMYSIIEIEPKSGSALSGRRSVTAFKDALF